MRNPIIALCAALALLACGKKDDNPPPATSAANSSTDKPEPSEGAPRIAIAADGVHVQFHVYGKGEPAVVLIHGWSCDSNYWREQVPLLKQKYTVVTVDLAGHGGTDGNRKEWSIGRFGQDVATAVATIPNQQIVLVGHSMGGPVAIEAARLLKSRAIGVIGVDTFNTLGGPSLTQAQVDALVKPFERDFIGQTRELVTEHLFPPGGNRELANKIAYDMSLSPPRVAIPSLRALLEYDYTEPLKDVSVPVVAIESDLGPPLNEARIRKLLPKFHAVVLKGTSHFLMMDDAAQFNPALETEIQALLAAQGS
jgi:pimeloyl-ACP methyl ester carboxylesterase